MVWPTDGRQQGANLGRVSGNSGAVAKKMHFMVVRSYKYPRPGMYSMANVDAYRQKLRSGDWNCFLHNYESEDQSSTDICNRALPNKQGREMVIMEVKPTKLTFIHISGQGSLAGLGSLGALGGLLGQPPTPHPYPTCDWIVYASGVRFATEDLRCNEGGAWRRPRR